MLKNVVLPAPLGPMIDTIDWGATAIETPLTATRPPKALLRRSVASSAPSLEAPPPAPRPVRPCSYARLDDLLVGGPR